MPPAELPAPPRVSASLPASRPHAARRAQVGVSLEPLAELAQKEGSKLGAKEVRHRARCSGSRAACWLSRRPQTCHLAGSLATRTPAGQPSPPTSPGACVQDFAKRVGLDLFNYMQSFGAVQALGGDRLVDAWFQKLINRLRRDPDYLTRQRDAV